MSAAMQEAVELIKNSDESTIYFVIEFLKHSKKINISKEKKLLALRALISLRKKDNGVSNDYKDEYYNYLDDRYMA